MAYPTDADYENLRLDMVSAGSVVNGAPDAADVVTRTARVIKPLAKVVAEAQATLDNAIDTLLTEDVAIIDAAKVQAVADKDAIAGYKTTALADQTAIAALKATGQADVVTLDALIAKYAGNYGSAQFPHRNGKNPDTYGFISQPVANIGTWFGGNAVLLFELDLPQEHLSNIYTHYLFGNSTSTGGRKIQATFTGYGNPGAAKGRFGFYCANGSGQSIGTIYSEVVPQTTERVLVAVIRSGSNAYIQVVDIDSGTVYAGAVAALGTMTGLTAAEMAVTSANLLIAASNSTNALSGNGFSGAIGKILYANYAPSDAELQSIAAGADPITVIGAANIKYYRKLNGAATGLAPIAAASSDATTAATAYGTVEQGSSIIAVGNITLDRKYHGYVKALVPGSNSAMMDFTGKFRTALAAADVVEARMLNADGTSATNWQSIAYVAAGATTYSGSLDVMKSTRFYMREVRLRSDPTKSFISCEWVGVGYVLYGIGQSQVANMARQSLNFGYYGKVQCSYVSLPQVNGTYFTQVEVSNGRTYTWETVGDGHFAFMNQFAEFADAVFCIGFEAKGGTSPIDWVNDSLTGYQWTDFAAKYGFTGSKNISAVVAQWATSIIDGVATNNTSPAWDAVVKGVGVSASNHFLYEAMQAGARFALTPVSRHNASAAGPFDYSNYSAAAYTAVNQEAWVAANSQLAAFGSYAIDVDLADQYHPLNSLTGDVRMGYHMAIAAARACLLDRSVNPSITAGSFAWVAGTSNASFTFKATLPNGGQLKNGLGATSDAGADKTVKGVEVSLDAGATWSRSGFTATITGRDTVTVTKTTGDWSASVANFRARVLADGPFAYGTGATPLADGNTDATQYCMYDNFAKCSNGLGLPIKPSRTVYAVA